MKNVLGADFQNSIGLFSKITPVINLDVAGA